MRPSSYFAEEPVCYTEWVGWQSDGWLAEGRPSVGDQYPSRPLHVWGSVAADHSLAEVDTSIDRLPSLSLVEDFINILLLLPDSELKSGLLIHASIVISGICPCVS